MDRFEGRIGSAAKSAWRRFGRIATAAALSGAFCAAHAQDSRAQAHNGAIADGVTTAVGLAAGAVEVNPLGPLLAMGMKAVTLQYAKSLPDTERPAVYAVAASMWQGAAANNMCVTAAILSGGSFTPVCIAIGVAWGIKTWKDTEHERQFWEGCAMLRRYADEPALECVYTAPDTTVAAGPREWLVAREVAAP